MVTIIYRIIILEGCNHIKYIKLESCKYIDNKAMSYLKLVQDSLTNLEIIRCRSLDEDGLRHLKVLKYVIHTNMSKIYLIGHI